MSVTEKGMNIKDLEGVIERAMKKTSSKTEAELSRYLSDDEGRMHHFTFRRLKMKQPKQLSSLLENQVLNHSAPAIVPAKPRKKRDSSSITIKLSPAQLNEIVAVLQKSGKTDLVEALSPKIPMKMLKKEVLNSIRSEKADLGLLESFIERLKNEKPTS